MECQSMETNQCESKVQECENESTELDQGKDCNLCSPYIHDIL